MRKVAAAEWLWVLLASIAILALFSIPYFVGQQQSTPAMTFGGFVFGLEDMNSYLAKMRYGAYDGWILQLVYTSEPHRGGVVYVYYLALGKLAAWISGERAMVSATTLIRAYHVARLICGLLYLLVLYRFIAEYLEERSQRRLAWILASLAGGLGWILLIVSLAQGNADARLPVEFYVPEAFSHLLIYGLPHLSLSRTFFLAGWLFLFQAAGNSRYLGWAISAGVAWLGMALIVPFYVGLLGVLIGAWLGGLWLTLKHFPRREAYAGMISGALPVFVMLYTSWVFTADPVYRVWWAQNALPSPPLIDYLMAYGLLLLGAIPGALQVYRDRDARSILLLVWPLAAAALVYSPINVQRRLLEGVIVPLSILTTLGIWGVIGEKSGEGVNWPWRLRQVGAGVMLMLLYP